MRGQAAKNYLDLYPLPSTPKSLSSSGVVSATMIVRLNRPRVTCGSVMGSLAVFADFGPLPGSEVGARNGQERVECGPERLIRAAGEVRRCSQEPAQVRGNRRDRARKNPNRERLGFCYWWWDGTPHQTTIESTESKRCGLLRTCANRIEKPVGTAFGCGQSDGFFALIGHRKGCSTSSSLRGQFNSQNGN